MNQILVLKIAAQVLAEAANKKRRLSLDEFKNAIWLRGKVLNLKMDEIDACMGKALEDMV